MDVILYLDCDGVIFDTIDTAFKEMVDNNVNLSNHDEIDNYFKKINWVNLMQKSEIINNSIDKIKEIEKSKLYKEIIILTKLSGSYYEEKVKRDTFNILLPKINIITLPRSYDKALVVNPKNHILVDDEDKNIHSWNNNGGIGIKFTKSISNPGIDIINDLNDIENTKGVKLLRKTRFF